ncbi:MAG: glucosamine-6-phosphate deaminase [Candidatus Pacearchaeota archaeon]|nr:glucosamine-6-phosphate deaminase [Candidatus Pacearchaeota archaeon]
MMRIIISAKEECIRKAAAAISEIIKRKPNATLGLATGSTMIPLYRELVRLYKKGEIDFSRVRTFNLDEYADLSFNDKNSYHRYMNRNFFNKVNIKKLNVHFPASKGDEYEKEIKNSGGLDLVLLGIGTNGHIAFNEPGSSFNSRTRKIKLSDSTIKSNSRFFTSARRVPEEAYTMGIKTIMRSRKIILLAFGTKKSNAVLRAIKGPITEKIPASVLRQHKDATFILDRKAAAQL